MARAPYAPWPNLMIKLCISNHSLLNDISQFYPSLYNSFLLFYLISHLFCHTTEYSIKNSTTFFSVLFKPTLKPTFYCRIIYLFATLCKIYIRKKDRSLKLRSSFLFKCKPLGRIIQFILFNKCSHFNPSYSF